MNSKLLVNLKADGRKRTVSKLLNYAMDATGKLPEQSLFKVRDLFDVGIWKKLDKESIDRLEKLYLHNVKKNPYIIIPKYILNKDFVYGKVSPHALFNLAIKRINTLPDNYEFEVKDLFNEKFWVSINMNMRRTLEKLFLDYSKNSIIIKRMDKEKNKHQVYKKVL